MTSPDSAAPDRAPFAQTYRALLQHAPLAFRMAVLAMVGYYEPIFGGRDAELAALDAFLAQDERSCALLLAPTGRGKTALLLHWLARVHAQGAWMIIFAPISRRYGTATADATFGALAQMLAAFHGESLQGLNIPPDQLRFVVADYLHRPPPEGRRLLLVLDALDEAIGWQMSRDTLAAPLPPYVKVVVSAREHGLLAFDAQTHGSARADPWLNTLGWRYRQTQILGLEALDRAAVAAIVAQLEPTLAPLASDPAFITNLRRVSEGDPLTLRYLVEALADGRLIPERLTTMPPGLQAYLEDWLTELRAQSGQAEAALTVLHLCARALGPLTRDDITALAPAHFATPIALADAIQPIARFIIGDGSEAYGYTFSHPRLRELFAEQLMSQETRAQIEQGFLDYGLRWYLRHLPPYPIYVRLFWITHLATAQQWPLIHRVLLEVYPTGTGHQQPWAQMRYGAEGSYAGYLADLQLLWQHAERTHQIALSLHCALVVASIRSLGHNMIPELLVALVTRGTPEGRWSIPAALAFMQVMPEDAQATVLGGLAPQLTGALLGRALDAAQAIRNADARARALQALAPQLPPEQQPAVLAHALDAAQAIADADARATALQALAPQLTGALLDRALDAAQAIADEYARATALQALAPQLPPEQQPAVLAQALDAAQAIADEYARADALQALAPTLATALPLGTPMFARWSTMLRQLVVHGRPALLQDLTALQPWLATLATPLDRADLAWSIADVSRCWP